MIADLFELARGQQTGRLPGDATSITLFKSVGTASRTWRPSCDAVPASAESSGLVRTRYT